MPSHLPAGWYVTDPARTPAIKETVGNLPRGIGVIFRHFGDAVQLSIARDLAGICREQGRPLLVSADPDLANAIGADGVHWPAKLARRATRAAGLASMSVHNVQELRLSRILGMDAILVSTVFPSDSPSARAAIGLERLARVRQSQGPTIYGLGGIDSSNCERTAKIAGFAAVSGLEEVFGPRT